MSLNIGAKFSKYTSKSNSKIYQKSYKWSEVAQLCPTLCDPVDCSLPGSSVHWIFQAIVLEWIAISFSRGSYQHRDRTQVSCIAGRFFTVWATREALSKFQFSSVQLSSVVSDCLGLHESQDAWPPCPSPTHRVHTNSCASSQWCHPAILYSVVPFSSCPQSLPASGTFPMNQLFAWGGKSIGVSALASVLPMNTQEWSPSEWTGWISLQSKGLSRVFSSTTV